MELPLQTRAVAFRIRSEGREGNPPGLSALAVRWVSILSGESCRAKPDIKEITVAATQALLALMELSSKFEFDLVKEATEAIRKKELLLPPPKPEIGRGASPGTQMGRRKKK